MKKTEQALMCDALRESIKNWQRRLKKSGITYRDLSLLSGVTENTIYRIINLKQINPTLNTLNAIEGAIESKEKETELQSKEA